ncbi:MAG: hypothetical protein AAFV30_07225, partial [Pseudomonadota bacterium]
ASSSATNSNSTRKRYRFGLYVWAKCRHHGIWLPNHPVYLASAPLLLGAAAAALSLHTSLWTLFVLIAALLFQALVTYVNAAQSEALAELRRESWDEFANLTEGVAGHLSQVLRHYHGRYLADDLKTKPDVYKEKLRSLQQLLLDHVVQVLHRQLGDQAPQNSLSANWTTRGIGEHEHEFHVITYNKNMTHRQPGGSWKQIAEGIPGASVSFLTGGVALVRDTNPADHEEHFSPDAPYRAILSIPVLCSEAVIGVVNVDSTKIGLLETEQHLLIFDIVYLVGLCQFLSDGV